MAYRKTPLVTGQLYHLFNRGVEKRVTFEDRWDYKRFIKTLYYYQFSDPKPKFSDSQTLLESFNFKNKLVNVICFCLMPNHFHLLIEQLKDGGISEFISKVVNSYTKYFNTKKSRVGPLFQGRFKSVLVENSEQLIHLSRYIHLNPIKSFLVTDLESYEWSSYPEYITGKSGLCSKDILTEFFKTESAYKEFILDQIGYNQTIEQINNKLIEEF